MYFFKSKKSLFFSNTNRDKIFCPRQSEIKNNVKYFILLRKKSFKCIEKKRTHQEKWSEDVWLDDVLSWYAWRGAPVCGKRISTFISNDFHWINHFLFLFFSPQHKDKLNEINCPMTSSVNMSEKTWYFFQQIFVNIDINLNRWNVPMWTEIFNSLNSAHWFRININDWIWGVTGTFLLEKIIRTVKKEDLELNFSLRIYLFFFRNHPSGLNFFFCFFSSGNASTRYVWNSCSTNFCWNV